MVSIRSFTSSLLLPVAMMLAACSPALAQSQSQTVVRATLGNGLRVVVIRNALAPVVTVEANVLVGGDETPAGFPGMAHAQEHMAFRGCTGMSADQTAAIYAELGGDNNADTQQNITQYFATVPAADLDVALHAQAACLSGIDDSQDQWAQERGAIEQEVSRDLSNPTYKFLNRLNGDIFAGTPYAHDPLGTKASFDQTTGAMLKQFHDTWYSPSNVILVIVGDVDPAATLAEVKAMYAKIPSHALPARPAVELQPVKSETFTIDSNLPYTLAYVAYRLPGTDSPDFAAVQILSDVLSSSRGDLYAMVPAGKALAAEFGVAETYPKASVGFALVAQPAGVDVSAPLAEMRSILNRYASAGVPEELVDAAKRSEIAQAEFQRNSIPGLASVWSTALAAEGRSSPDEDVEAIRKVTVADVNRVAKQYLLQANTITATLLPKPTGEPTAAKGFGGAEQVTSAPTKPVTLPTWAAATLDKLSVPAATALPSDVTLANGIRLIVRQDRTTPTVTLVGSVQHTAALETPRDEEGISQVLDGLYSYGTTSLDRIAFQKALDDIAANESAGYGFSLTVLKDHFSRGVQLLADNELHPALPAAAFSVVKQQTSELVAANRKTPGYLSSRALELGLLPAGDPVLREATGSSVAKLTLDQVHQYYESTMRPDLTTIVIVGDVSPADARAAVEQWFGGWKANGTKPPTTLPAAPMSHPGAVSVPDPEQVQDSVTLAEELPMNRFDPDYYALQLGNHVLGGGFYATRLYRDLREKAGYVYSVDVALAASKSRARYEVVYGCDPQNVSKARGLIERDLNQMRTDLVSPDELHQAKALLLRQLPLSASSEESVADGFLARAQLGLPLDEIHRAAERYAVLTPEAVRDAFARHVFPDHFFQVVQGPAPQ